MRVLVIGGTGFIGAHIVRQIASHGHSVAIYHPGFTPAALVPTAREITDSRSVMPILYFPSESFEFDPNVVILTVSMGAADARAAVEAPIFLSTLEKCFKKVVFEPPHTLTTRYTTDPWEEDSGLHDRQRRAYR
jgi:hypothetical protein